MENKKDLFVESDSDFYDLEYFISLEYRYLSGAHRSKVNAVLDILGDLNGKRCLDLGCGTGFFTEKMHKLGAKVTGVDYSEHAINFARDRFRQLDFRNLSLYDLGAFHDSEFDVVLLLDVIEHVGDQEKLFKELSRILKPGGKIVISTDLKDSAWNKNWMKKLIWASYRLSKDGWAYLLIKRVEAYRKSFRDYHKSHIGLLTKTDLLKKVQDAGFSLGKYNVYPLVAVLVRDIFLAFLPERWRGEHQILSAIKR